MHLHVVIFIGAVTLLALTKGESKANHPTRSNRYQRKGPGYPAKRPHKCDACEKTQSGFDENDAFFDELMDKIEDLGLPDLRVDTRFKEAAAIGDLAETDECPEGSIVISCRCGSEATGNCKGVKISADQKKCTVTPGDPPIDPVTVRALCATNNNDQFKIENNAGASTSHECSEGRKAIDCWQFDPEFPSVLNYDARTCECYGVTNCFMTALCANMVEEMT